MSIDIDPGDPSPPSLRLGDDDSGVVVSLFVSDYDGETVVQIDTEGPHDAHCRVNVNDGELATVRLGGDYIQLPGHHHEFHRPVVGGGPATQAEARAENAKRGVAQPVLLVYGNPSDGFHFVGPVVPNDPDLDRFVDELTGIDWWYAPIRTLEQAWEGE